MSKFYLVILENNAVDIKDIISSPSEIIEFIENERKTSKTKRKIKRNS